MSKHHNYLIINAYKSHSAVKYITMALLCLCFHPLTVPYLNHELKTEAAKELQLVNSYMFMGL